jgi:hypothetical protein
MRADAGPPHSDMIKKSDTHKIKENAQEEMMKTSGLLPCLLQLFRI